MYRQCEIGGRRVCYVDEGAGEPVLLLHGYPQNHLCWRHQIPALAERYRVIAPDWPGFGRSEPPASAPAYESEVQHIDALADLLGLDRFNLVAHDYGGFLSLGYIRRQPTRVQRLALLNTRAHRTFRPWFYRYSLAQHWIATHRLPAAVARRAPLGRMHHLALSRYRALGCFDAALEREYLGWMDTPGGRRTFWNFFAHYHVPEIPGLADSLSDIRCPTTVIWGDRDPYIPFDTARELADRIRDATLVRLRGADHYVMEQRPQQVAEALLELLSVNRAASPVGEATER